MVRQDNFMKKEHLEYLNSKEPGEALVKALTRLIDKDRDLFEINVNERSITHKFALYLQEIYKDWNVDCEYNRKGHDIKELEIQELKPNNQDSDAQTVFPDIIIHKRVSDENYLVIEAKKTSSSVSKKADIKKLNAFRDQLGYQYALFIEFSVKPNEAGINDLEWVGA